MDLLGTSRGRGLLVILTWSCLCWRVTAGEVWREHTFDAFRHGGSDDGGINLYAAADGTVRSVYTFDYDTDGANDLLYVCSHDNWYAPPAYLYMNENGRLDPRFRLPLVNEGSQGGTIADLNGDQWPDVILCGTHNGQNSAALDAIVYYGSALGFAAGDSDRLPTYYSEGVAVLDCNGDGQLDLAFAQAQQPGILIYLADKGRFDRARKKNIDCPAVSCIRTADFNGDNRTDLCALSGSKLTIYAAGAKGLAHEPAVSLETQGSGRFAIADLDKNGHADVVVANKSAKLRVDIEVKEKKSPTIDTLIYWGGADGFKSRPPTKLPSLSSRDVAVADFNQDSWTDVAVANYGKESETGDAPTTIYWGSETGFDPGRKLDLDTRFATALGVEDIDRNGLPDLIIGCHRTGESYNATSYVYLNEKGGFSRQGRVGLPTLGAAQIATGDVDRNGWPDVLFLSFSDGTKGLSNARIHWNDGKGRFSLDRQTLLPIHDAFSHVATDLNLDGHTDIVFAESYEYGRWRDQGSVIYWGSGGRDWTPSKQSHVPTGFATSVVTADLNRDGWLDLAFGQLVSWEDDLKPSDRRQPVFYGSKDGFSKNRMELLPVEDPRGITVADLNKDGWPDLVYSNLSYDDVPIFWGSSEGYSADRRTRLVLPEMHSVTVTCADVNNDGWLDILASCHMPALRNSYVFLGSPKGFDVNRRIELPTMAVQGACLADFDRNGWLDVFLPSYSTRHINRTWTSFLYYNGEKGYSIARCTGLLTDSGSGALALDFNGDGWLDLSVACHARPNGDHRANSLLFFGGPEGFSDYRKLSFATEGSHDITHVDAGHLYHRRFEMFWTSGVHEAATPVTATALNWLADTPHGSRLRFQVRLSDSREELESAVWQGPTGPDSFFDSPRRLPASLRSGRFAQYRVQFISRDGSNYPLLREVSIELEVAGK